MATTYDRDRIEALYDVEAPRAWLKAGSLVPGDVIRWYGRWITVERVEVSEFLVGGVQIVAGPSVLQVHADERVEIEVR